MTETTMSLGKINLNIRKIDNEGGLNFYIPVDFEDAAHKAFIDEAIEGIRMENGWSAINPKETSVYIDCDINAPAFMNEAPTMEYRLNICAFPMNEDEDHPGDWCTKSFPLTLADEEKRAFNRILTFHFAKLLASC